MFDEGIGIGVWDSENVFFFVSRDDFVSVLRVEILQFVERCSSEFTYLLEVKLLADFECIYSYRHSYGCRLDAMFLVVVKCVECSYECWYISACFTWKIWPDVPECSLTTCTADSFVDISCSAVI